MSQKCSRRAETSGETGPVVHKGDMSGAEAFHWLSSQRLLGVGSDRDGLPSNGSFLCP